MLNVVTAPADVFPLSSFLYLQNFFSRLLLLCKLVSMSGVYMFLFASFDFVYDYFFCRQLQVVCTIFWINFEWDLVGSQVNESGTQLSIYSHRFRRHVFASLCLHYTHFEVSMLFWLLFLPPFLSLSVCVFVCVCACECASSLQQIEAFLAFYVVICFCIFSVCHPNSHNNVWK